MFRFLDAVLLAVAIAVAFTLSSVGLVAAGGLVGLAALALAFHDGVGRLTLKIAATVALAIAALAGAIAGLVVSPIAGLVLSIPGVDRRADQLAAAVLANVKAQLIAAALPGVGDLMRLQALGSAAALVAALPGAAVAVAVSLAVDLASTWLRGLAARVPPELTVAGSMLAVAVVAGSARP